MDPQIEEALKAKQKQEEDAKKQLEDIDIEIEDEEAAREEEETPSKDVDDDDDGENEGNDEEKSSEDDKKKPARKSRAKDRIHQLLAEKKELEEKLRKEAEEREKLSGELKKTTSASKKAEQERISSQLEQAQSDIKSIKERAKQALQNDDLDAYTDLQADLSQRIVDVQILSAKKSKFETESVQSTAEDAPAKVEKTQTQQQQGNPDLPEPMKKWLGQNTWFLYPQDRDEELKRNKVIRTSNAMESEGWDFKDPSFYDELEDRISQGVAPKGKTVVDLDESQDDEPVETDEDVKENTSKTNTSTPTSKKSPVSGGTQTPSNPNVSNTKKGTKVRLTAEQRAFAKRMNIPEDVYAKQLMEQEKKLRSQ